MGPLTVLVISNKPNTSSVKITLASTVLLWRRKIVIKLIKGNLLYCWGSTQNDKEGVLAIMLWFSVEYIGCTQYNMEDV